MSRLSPFSRDPFGGEHGRARELAAVRISEPLETAEEAWLEDHLAGCQQCRAVAEAYEAQGLALRRLPPPEPPRDLWARTAAALDQADRQGAVGRDRRRAARIDGRSPGYRRRLGRDTSPAMLGTMAAALVVAVVLGSTLLAGALRPAPEPTGGPSLALGSAAPTPIVVPSGRVVWASHQDDGTYALNIAPVDRVCPANGEQACAPLDSSARKLVALTFQPKAVVLSQNRPEAVVVGPAAHSTGTSIFVVSLPSDSIVSTPSTKPSQGSPSLAASSPAGTTRATPPPSSAIATPKNTSPATRTPPVSVSSIASPSITASAASGSVQSPSVLSSPAATAAGPSPTATIAILDNVVLAGESAAYSPDGAWFAFSARPADGSRGPDIYVWRVGDAEATPITSDHASIFSAWLGNRVLGSTVGAESPTASTVPSPTPSTSPATPSPAAVAPSPSSRPASTQKPRQAPSVAPSPSAPPLASDVPPAPPEPSPGDVPVTLVPRSFAVDPVTGIEESLGDGIWRPVVDPTGSLVLYWRGTLAFDPASSSWQPAQGDLYLAPWSTIAPPDLLPASPSPSNGASGSPGGSGSPPAAGAGSTVPPSTTSPAADASPRGSSPSTSSATTSRAPLPLPTRRPSAAPGASGGASPAGASPSEGTAASRSPLPSGAASESPSESASAAPSPLAPELLGPDDPPTGLGPTSWDARWDATGTHLAIWVGDPLDLAVGRLSLLTIDPATARQVPDGALLEATPALPGFSLNLERLAWVTPPGQNGQGSELQVMAWQGDSAGTIESLPIPETEQLVVAR